MRNAAKVGLGLIFLAGVYLLILLIVGFVAGGVVRGRIQSRLAQSLDAEVRVGSAKLGLVRGVVTVRDLEVERRKLDLLSVSVKRVDVDVAPLGWVLVDRGLRHERVRGARMTITGAGALQLPARPAAPPIRLGGLDLQDAVLDLQATGYWPGLARLVVTVERARTGPTTMRTPLSWLFTLEELVARVDLPGGVTIRLGFANGKLSASGGFFGTTPVTIDFVLPKLDAAAEVPQLIALGKELAKQLALERARRWIRAQIPSSLPTP